MTTTFTRSVPIEDIEAARAAIRDAAVVTPSLRQFGLDERVGGQLYLKAENLQRTGAFKFRGAYNTLLSLQRDSNPEHVITSSSGNHGQAVAAAGALLGIRVTVVMPENAVPIKVEAVRRYGGRVEFAGTTSLRREARAREIGESDPGVVIGSFDDPRIIAGQGTAGLEIVDQVPNVDVVVVPVGGGGLISGIATAVKASHPGVKVFGVEPSGAGDAFQSLKAGHIVTLDGVDTIADGLRTSRVGNLNFAIMSKLLDGIVLVDDSAILNAVRDLAFSSKLTVEPSGAVAAAAVLEGKIDVAGGTVVALVSGGNVDPSLFETILRRQKV